MKIERGPFLGSLGPTLAQNLSRTQERLVVQAQQPHRRVSRQILLKDRSLLRKFKNL